MSYKTLVYTRESSFISPEENIAVIKINRPEVLNSLNNETLTELERLLDEIGRDEQVKVVVITAEGEKAFSAGLDLKEAMSLDEAGVKSTIELGQRVMKKIEDLDKPVIAAINGLTLGGGLEMALAADIRVASDTVKFGCPEVSVGLVPGWGGTQRLPKVVGKGKAMELILSGGMIDAKEAERIGLVNKIVPADELSTTVNWTAGKIASNAPVAVKHAKKLVNKAYEVDVTEGNKLEAGAVAACSKTEDLREGVKAVFEKRSPQFKGK